MERFRPLWLFGAALGSASACSSDDVGGTGLPVTAADAGDGAGGGQADAPAGTACPADLPGPELVFIPAGAASFCIDAREVRQGEYAVFVDAAGLEPPAQPPECDWNERFDPNLVPVPPPGGDVLLQPGDCLEGTFDPETRADYAMSCVDWCDARAYCAWAGKRLCDGLGELEETLETQTDPAVSEWQYVCTNGGLSSYPYGDEYIAGKCVDESSRTDLMGSLGSAVCRGSLPPFDAVRDLVGSLEEWTAACDARGRDCSVQGSSFMVAPAPCSYGGHTYMRSTNPGIGFRCCADAI